MKAYKIQGFTLIEMAVVLVIVGLMLGGLLVPLSTQMETDRRKETAATLESIREALIGFAIINKRLPCPDTSTPPDGLENCPSAAANDGSPRSLPYATLGVSRTDAWGNNWNYAVTNAFADQTAPITTTTVGIIDVGTTNNNCGSALLASGVPALVISDGNATNPGALELENTNTVPNSCYIDAGYRRATPTSPAFDDLLVWIPRGQLLSRMAAAKQLP